MLPAAHRLRSRREFSTTTRRGAKASRGSVVAYVHLTDDPASPAQVGLIVSKAVGGSVSRHRTARRLRSAVAPLVPDLPHGCRVVLRALPGAVSDPRLPEDVRLVVTAALDRTRVQ